MVYPCKELTGASVVIRIFAIVLSQYCKVVHNMYRFIFRLLAILILIIAVKGSFGKYIFFSLNIFIYIHSKNYS